ncbi:MAG: CoA transferase [Chitinophagaceae bacterium]|nr:CoA transferase [Rubrivivax sp.]
MENASAATTTLPLAGIVVLDLGQIYQGPYCSLLLAMAGATVIKIEPLRGEPARLRADVDVASLPLAMLNSNKLGITLNLKAAEGRELFLQLADKADVVQENFAPGVMDRLGLGADALRARNPRLIYASASGYGTAGPYRDFLAMDLTIQAMSGIMEATGFPEGPPVKAGPAISDFLGGIHLYGAILTALYARERSGQGRTVEVAMLDAVYPALCSNLGMHHATKGAGLARTGNRHGGLSMAPYNVYPTTDGYAAIICVTDEHWRSLARAMGRDDLATDARYATHADRVKIMAEVDAVVGGWTSGLSKDEVFQAARRAHLPAAPVRGLDEIVNDPHLIERGMLQRLEHPDLGSVVLPTTPLRLSDAPPPTLQPSPRLGQHNAQVYGDWLGLDPTAIEALREAKVI